MKLESLRPLLLVAWAAISCGEAPRAPGAELAPAAVRTARQEVRSTNKVLILGSSVDGGVNSPEAQAVRAFTEPDWPIDVVDPAQWLTMTPEQFMSYRAIVIGDGSCTRGTALFQAAIDTRASWGPVIDGDVVIVGTNTTSGSKPQIMQNGIQHVLMNSEQYRTGLYVSLGCAYQDAPPGTPVQLLELIGGFSVEGSASSCAATAGHMFQMNPPYVSSGLDDAYLGRDGCAARSVFTTYPVKNFAVAAIGLNAPGADGYRDYLQDEPTLYFGTPYILVRGAASEGSGCGGNPDNVPSGEECDLGDNGNGVPATPGTPPDATCSFSCHLNWCGDGFVDAEFGEQCDNGGNNGRANDGNGTLINGMCSKSCKIVQFPAPPNSPPTARCRDVTVDAPANACGAPADINNGSSDPDGDAFTCTQGPASPYNIGNTTVTLVCTDSRNQTATCTGTVTVRDVTPPVVTVGTPNRSMECANTTYVDLSDITASDLCSNPVTMLAPAGTVDMRVPGTYTRTYSARDTAGNVGSAARTVDVMDTRAPNINLSPPTTMQLECGTPYTEPGYSATDSCHGNLTGSVVVSGTADTSVVGQYLLRYNLTDPSGNDATQRTRTVNVSDTQRPTVTILGGLSQTVECNDPAYQDPGATATDSCAGDLPPVPSAVVDPSAPGSYVITYSATDPSGNTGTSATSRTVMVSDTLNPVLTLNGATAMNLECASPWNDPGAMANDQCAGDLTGLIQRTGDVNNMQPAAYRLTYSVTDPSGRSDSKERAVTVRDTLVPEISVQGPLADSFECGNAYLDPGATANDACAGDVPVTSERIGNPDHPGTFTVRYSAQDPSGNSVTSPVVRTVTVNDDTPPTLVLLGSATESVECATPWNDPGATANDACFGDLTAAITRTGNVNNMAPNSYTLTYNVTDGAGLSATPVTRTVNVNDTLAPTITVLGPLNQSVQCDRAPYADPGATAADSCAGNLTSAIVRTGSVDTGAAGSYTLSYRVSDPSGNQTTAGEVRTVTVVDDQPPTLSLTGPANGTHECGSPYNDPGATANDACAGDLTANIQRSGAVNGGAPGSYTIDYTVTDPSNLTASTRRQVTVNDTLAPVLTLIGPAIQNVECGPDYQDPGATATDACEGNLDARINVDGAANPLVVGNYIVTYRVSDSAGQAAPPVGRQVQVRDTVAPNITVNGPLDQQFECGDTYVDPGATANDVCAGAVAVTAAREGSSTTPGQFTIRYSATDPSGNTVTSPVTRTVRVNDNEAPTLVLLGSAAQTLECGTTWDDPGAQASDACAGDLTSAIRRSGSVNTREPGSYTLSYEVEDEAENAAPSISRQVTVTDTQPPSIVCPDPITVEALDGTSATVTLGTARATDACSELLVSTPSQTRFPVGTTSVEYVAVDRAGNEASCSSTVTVVALSSPPMDRALLGSGNGCSSTGGGPSSLAVMGLGVLAALLSRKRTWPVLLAMGVLLLGARASAELEGVPTFELELLKLNPSGTGSLLLGTGELLPDREHRLSLTTHYENDPLVLFQNGEKVGVVVRHRATAHLAAAYGLWGWVELGAQVPVLLLQRGDDLTDHGIGRPEGGLTPGTPLLTFRVKLLAEREEDPVDLSLGVHAGPSVGSGAALARELRATPSLMAGRRFSALRTAIDAGILLRPRKVLSPDDDNVQDELGHALRLGGTVSTLGEGLRGELAVITLLPLKREGPSTEALAGARWPVSDSFEAYGLAGLAFGNAPGTPDFRVLLGVAYGRARAPRVASIPQEPVSEVPELPGPPAKDGEAVQEKDTDGDDILDGNDACPAEAGIPEMRGCPARDTDQDTVQDHQDNCPEVAGPVDNQGCPAEEKQLVAIQKDRIEIKDTVHFDFDKATIQSRSFPLLDQVARILTEHPEILSVTIEGHTDERGSAEYNRDLSHRRAEAVRDYLAQKGVAPARMQARGFGEDRPVQSNATDEGRAANRRVEFITRYTQAAP